MSGVFGATSRCGLPSRCQRTGTTTPTKLRIMARQAFFLGIFLSVSVCGKYRVFWSACRVCFGALALFRVFINLLKFLYSSVRLLCAVLGSIDWSVCLCFVYECPCSYHLSTLALQCILFERPVFYDVWRARIALFYFTDVFSLICGNYCFCQNSCRTYSRRHFGWLVCLFNLA